MWLRTHTFTTLSVGGLALIAAFVLLLGSLGGSSTVQATDPPPTPKNANDGSLGGTYDILVPAGTLALPNKAFGLYHCIIKIDHAIAGDEIDTWVVCYDDINLGDADGEPPARPGEGPDVLPGPVPPPPYTTLEPQRGTGAVSGGKLALTTCFSNIGAARAPNMMVTVNIPAAKAQLAGGPPKFTPGVMAGIWTIYANMSDANCAALDVTGASGSPLPVNFYKVTSKSGADAGCDDSPFINRATRCLDYDLDGCGDEAELEGVKVCGDDPYNPYDSNIANITGTYSSLWTVAGGPNCPAGAPIQCPWDGTGNPGPGITFHCIASINDPGGALPRAVTQRLYCYTDSPASDVNTEAFPGCKGDGFPGASPPGKVRANFQAGPPAYTCGGAIVWGDVSTIKHTQLNGTLTAKTLTTTGCFEDDDGMSSLGNVYVSATQDRHGGLGTVSIYAYLQPSTPAKLANCLAGTLTGGVQLPLATLQAARQSNNLLRDTDNDGCTDAEELGNDPAFGGLRDPYNRWDFYDVDGNGEINLFDDIFGVQFQYGLNAGDPGYDEAMDRGPLIAGANDWNLPGPDGTIDLVNDMFGVAFQFGHACDDGAPGGGGLFMWGMELRVIGGACDDPQTPTTCIVPLGQGFVLSVDLPKAPPGGYFGIQTAIDYSDLVENGGGYTPLLASLEIVWPDAQGPKLRSPLTRIAFEGIVAHASASAWLPLYELSTFTGSLVWVVMNCSDGESVSAIDLIPFQAGYPLGSGVRPDFGGPTADSLLVQCSNGSDTDTDGDGCAGAEELGADEALGGRRNPLNPWDFFDTNGDKEIDLFIDIFGVAFAFGDDADSDPPGEPDGYDASLDRSAAAGGMDVWDMQAPDGLIDLFIDIFGVAFQYGHSCAGPP